MSKYVVIQDGWLPEPFDTVEEAKGYKDELELDATRNGTTTRVHVYQVIIAAMLLKLTFGIVRTIDYIT